MDPSQRIDEHDLQALIVRGFAKLEHARFLPLRLEDPVAAKAWLGEVSSRLTRGDAKVTASALQLALAFGALVKLGVNRETLAGFAIEFQEGLDVAHRSEKLGDVGGSDPNNWERGSGQRRVDAMLLCYAKDAAGLQQLVATERALAEASGWSLVATRSEEEGGLTAAGLDTHVLRDQHGFREHFGFRDGVGQPLLTGLSRTAAADQHQRHTQLNTIAAGEVVLGYRNAYGKLPFSPRVAVDPTGKLAAHPNGGRDLGRNSTYLVFRQIQQDVEGFWRFLDGKTNGDADERIRVAAKMVGRWPSGAPLVRFPDRDRPGHERANDFTYRGFPEQDDSGDKCPLGAHIRRANPRDSTLAPDRDDAVGLSNRHRLLRRGRPYGKPVDPSFDLVRLLENGDFSGERGLHFIALNANIGRQFEFVQHTWCNSRKFAHLHDDPDPIVSAGGQFTIQESPVRRRITGLRGWTETRGGAYLWLPSFNALDYLARFQPPTALQKHAAFFDRDSDGFITLRETFEGLRRLGLPLAEAVTLTAIINVFLSVLTKGPPLQIAVADIVLGKHAFDTAVFNDAGEMDMVRFDELFSTVIGAKGAPADSDALTRAELDAFITAGGARGRPYGPVAHWFSRRETQLIFCLAADGAREVDGRTEPTISRAMLRDFYRGNLFPKLERLRAIKAVGGFGMPRG